VRLLLDEMWPSEIAEQLRQRGHDVVAVTERPELRGQADSLVFAAAQAESRAVFTENISDYRPLAAYELQHGRSHRGLVFTSNRRFPRHESRTMGRVVTALDEFLTSTSDLISAEHWLE
jgi:hypothetical protein